jgi:hypothetical protein
MQLTDLIKHPYTLDETSDGVMLLFECSLNVRDALHYAKIFVRVHEEYQFVTYHCGRKTVLIFEKMFPHGQGII